MLHQRTWCLFIVSFVVLCVVPNVISASAHKHVHGKERTEDGAFSPRDHNHLDQGQYFHYIDLSNRLHNFIQISIFRRTS